MIGKVLRSGGSTAGLVRYLFGPGEANEHENARVIAGWDELSAIAPDPEAAAAGLRRLGALLDAPNKAAGGGPGSIYHLILSSARADEGTGLPADPGLSDGQWADIARDVMRRAGLIRDDGGGVRWIAVRHDQVGAEHVHVVATLADQDTARRVHPKNDFYRIGEGCRAAEQAHGLRSTSPRDRTAAPTVTRAEAEKSVRLGRTEQPRDVLRRQVREAVGRSSSTAGFLDELRGAGLLVRERLSPATGEVTGYAVALAGSDKDRHGQAVFYGGGRLASDLTLPKVRARYGEATGPRPGRVAREPAATPSTGSTPPTPGPRLSAEERVQVWAQAQAAAEHAARAIAGHAQNPAAAADAAWATSDYLTGAARLVAGSWQAGPLEQAAREMGRAAREQWGRVPAPSAAGQGLRAAGGSLLAARFVQHGETRQLLQLLGHLQVLADAVTRMREAQGREEQAAAARRAGEHARALYEQRSAVRAAPPRPSRQGLHDEDRAQHVAPTAAGRGLSR